MVQPSISQEEIDAALDGGGQEVFSQTVLQGPGHAQARQELSDIQERHRDMLRLEGSIAELHQLFLDMSVLVEAQGELLDQVEYTVAQSVDYTGRAVDELRSAAYYQEIARDCERCDPRRPVFISLGLRLRGLRLRASGESAALLQGTHYCRRGFSLPHRSPRDCSCVLIPRWTPRCARRPLGASA